MEHSVKILLFLILTSLTSPLLAADWTIGITAYAVKPPPCWRSLVDSRNHAVPDAHFRLLPLDLDGMREAVNQGTIQFVLTNPGGCATQRSLSSALAVVVALRAGRCWKYAGTGSAILVEVAAACTILGWPGKTLGAVDTQAFGGYLLGYRALRDAGLQVDESKVRFCRLSGRCPALSAA